MKEWLRSLVFLSLVVGVAGCTHDAGTPRHGFAKAPIEYHFRQAKTDPNGYVLSVKNDSNETVSCRVVSRDTTISHGFTLSGGEEQSFGLLQVGRAFKGQEKGTIEVDGYSSLEFQAP